jgi:XTP/dITP diphosphohydrolase
MKIIHFITQNKYKIEIAKTALQGLNISIVPNNIATPEIQSFSVEEVADYSAKWAANKLNAPVMVSDAGFFIEALNGFPGPFIKYINKWLGPDDFLNLMRGKSNRKVIHKDCLAFCRPDHEPVHFVSESSGTIGWHVGKSGYTSMASIFIFEGQSKPQSELSDEEVVSFFAKNNQNYKNLAVYLKRESLH